MSAPHNWDFVFVSFSLRFVRVVRAVRAGEAKPLGRIMIVVLNAGPPSGMGLRLGFFRLAFAVVFMVLRGYGFFCAASSSLFYCKQHGF